jgi:signal transduction histidine kinase
MQSPRLYSWRFAAGVTAATLMLFGAVMGWGTWKLREGLRDGVLQREAEALYAVALMELGRTETRLAAPTPDEAPAAFFAVVLESSRLRGVMAVDLFNASGHLENALPAAQNEARVVTWWPPAIANPTARFHPEFALENIVGPPAPGEKSPVAAPMLEVVVPLRLATGEVSNAATARFWVAGDAVAAELKRIDRGLLTQTSLTYLGTGILLGVVLLWSFRRLGEANRQLQAQSEDLARANEELDFAAKTGALGAISAHLIHGLKNPLAGLESFVSDPASPQEAPQGEAWSAALATTRNLRSLVQEVMSVLRDEADGQADYPVPLAEMLDSARRRVGDLAREAGVEVRINLAGEIPLPARTANLTGLIVVNLLQNAIEASPRGSAVTVEAASRDSAVELRFTDAGPGVPAAVRERLFRAVPSGKRRGGGVGLAISRQLARHISGELELVRTGPTGTVFCLRLPARTGTIPVT